MTILDILCIRLTLIELMCRNRLKIRTQIMFGNRLVFGPRLIVGIRPGLEVNYCSKISLRPVLEDCSELEEIVERVQVLAVIVFVSF